MLVFSVIFVLSSASPVAAQTVAEALRLRVEQLHDGGATSIRGSRLIRRDAVAHFFQQRGFAPVWRIPMASDQIRRAIVEIDQDGLNPAEYHLAPIDTLLALGLARTVADDADLQLLLTDAVAALVDHVRYGKVRPVTLDRRWNVDPREGAPPLEEDIARIAGAASLTDAVTARKLDHFVYRGLKEALARLRTIETAGGWPTVAPGPTLKPGATGLRVGQMRARLTSSGELAPTKATATLKPVNELFDPTLEDAVKRFQDHHRLTADGIIGPATVDAMNVPVRGRIEQVRANLERARWVLGGLQDTFILVNLPAFKAYYIREGKNVWESRTQIGREARQTPTFRADMRYLVLNPDWTVPPTILANDVLAEMKKGVNAIKKKGLTILDRRGRVVSPTSIDWQAATPGNFPYTLRQPPGPDNALGRVKFVFPNEHTIFLHDTPSRELFRSDTRTFSSGCIRVERALELAAALLQRQNWTPEKIEQAIAGGRSETIPLERAVPVLIVYWTVSVGASGALRFARDVYAHDPPLIRALTAR